MVRLAVYVDANHEQALQDRLPAEPRFRGGNGDSSAKYPREDSQEASPMRIRLQLVWKQRPDVMTVIDQLPPGPLL